MERSTRVVREDKSLVFPQWAKPEPFSILGRTVLPQNAHARVGEVIERRPLVVFG